MAQDLPPVGGYEPIQWKRNLPSRGFKPIVYFLGVIGICSIGFYQAISGIHERNELYREKIWARLYLQPLLQAETDRDAVRRHYAQIAREAEITKNVTGFDAEKSVYNDGKFRKPSVIALPKNI
ncbi:uncharacterized protein SAPINGB_P002313 [Magnusiomyces paraingens]|uniref:NADH dehydrogenase [ubiquinone] 1 alpha subcomplex subunit 13 n=1 Tax=Magnusiomyces paraingens TaxID=2606893 RepID=A0A5E8BJ56_9ASCO|nr:uncharacterized protein SAPINGB_P002313 [Saprochaete ingens]VVT49527.1 unnamed protein product [Saprochaete ingens]